MGTTLTGTTPQDTYDSLIKVTDNGPLSGTAKYLSDGLGNDSVLALSTSRVGIGTASPNQKLHINGGNVTIDDSSDVFLSFAKSGVSKYELYLDNASNNFGLYDRGATSWRLFVSNTGNVGIGTSSPDAKLSIVVDDVTASPIRHIKLGGGTAVNGNGQYIQFSTSSVDSLGSQIQGNRVGAGASSDLRFLTTSASSVVSEKLRILSDGGITFNGDTAAANALDDYEEGTWTMGVSFGGASVGVTYNNNTGTYTKIGRQVTVNGYMFLSSKGSSTGSARITGLPFTIPNSASNYATASIWLAQVSFANQYQGVGAINTTTIDLQETTEAGVITTLTDANFAGNSEVIISLTYFV